MFVGATCFAQVKKYTTANAHSHNDYEQAQPFWLAYNAGFGSIEADIFLVNDSLFVAHDTVELGRRRTLEGLYLEPLVKQVEKNNGHVYEDAGKNLQLMIDVKTEGISTLKKLMEVLERYPSLIKCTTLHFVISGNRPDEKLFTSYPSYLLFDGELTQSYSQEAMTKIVMLSTDFENFSKWKGEGLLNNADVTKLKEAVKKAHDADKTVRFWDAPDNANAWKQLMQLNVDYLNTDKIEELKNFLKANKN